MQRWVSFHGLALLSCAFCMGGCLTTAGLTSAHVGCPEHEIQVTNEERGWGTYRWAATCRGRTYHCVQISSSEGAPHVSCKGEPQPAHVAPAQPQRAPAVAGCQYDTQCRGERICVGGRCVYPKTQDSPATTPSPEPETDPHPQPGDPDAPPP